MENLRKYGRQFGIELSAEQLAAFATYRARLIEWNARMNLTRIIEPDAIVVRHFLDSLTCAIVTGDLSGKSLIDVGTGAGFPGLPLKILFPAMRLTLTDSVAKKTRFLEAVVEELGLQGVDVVAERAETLGQQPNHREQYDWAVGRSVAQLRVLAEYLLPLTRLGGMMLAMKGSGVEGELDEARVALKTLGGAAPLVRRIELPEREEAHFLLTVEKVAATPAKYPRRAGKPTKQPL